METKGITRQSEVTEVKPLNLTRTREEIKRKKKQEQESITLIVARHAGCGGDIIYRSSFELAVSVLEMRLGGPNPTREVMVCSCDTCGAMFDPSFSEYRKQVVAYRNR